MAQEITLRDELETGRLDLAAEHALFDAMERLADRAPSPGRAEWSAITSVPPGLSAA